MGMYLFELVRWLWDGSGRFGWRESFVYSLIGIYDYGMRKSTFLAFHIDGQFQNMSFVSTISFSRDFWQMASHDMDTLV